MEKIRIGILGAGGIANTLAAVIGRMDEAAVTAVAARDYERAKEFAGKYGFEKAYGSYEELAADDDLDLIYIATPHSHHYEHMKLCLAHGRNILCEKAFTANAGQAREMIEMAKARGVLLMEAVWTRYFPQLHTLRELLDGGAIGKVESVEASLGNNLRGWARLDEPELAGGALLDMGVYALTFASMVLGDQVEDFDVFAKMSEKGVDLQDSITLRYKDGSMAVLHCSMESMLMTQGLISGQQGMILIDEFNHWKKMTVYNKQKEITAVYEKEAGIRGYEYEIREACRCLREGLLESPLMPLQETLRIMELMDAIRAKLGMKYPFE
ncbi:Gfo/Idh/MocA family oxidoreductase [Diplocloster hominis]|uniref:Gfo/Idh/MocA family protein n=1 Tax=Diplocloster hominis TaxID=3079010 RepID=UPI0031B9F953